jgi:hypothetical protein
LIGVNEASICILALDEGLPNPLEEEEFVVKSGSDLGAAAAGLGVGVVGAGEEGVALFSRVTGLPIFVSTSVFTISMFKMIKILKKKTNKQVYAVSVNDEYIKFMSYSSSPYFLL